MQRFAFLLSAALVWALVSSCAPADPATPGDPELPAGESYVDQSYYALTSTELDHNPGDLNVGWIRRLPTIDYVWGSTNPTVQGWPAAGSTVTWEGHIRNRSDFARNVAYQWYLNGTLVKSGTVYLAAQSYGTVTYAWTWSFTRNTIQLVIDPSNAIPEVEEGNNSLTVYSNAISVALYFEQGIYDYFNAHQWELAGAHSVSLEDWAQRQVSKWNTKLSQAIFPLTPSGVTDRIRLDNVVITGNGTLPLSGGGPATNRPNDLDRTVDLQWGFVGSQIPPGNMFYGDTTTVSESNPFYYEGSLFHELGHARYLVDTYGFDVHHTTGPDKIYILEGGISIPGTSYMPWVSGSTTMVHANNNPGLMAGDYSRLDEFSARALNRIAGARAVLGNYNAPGNIGVFLNSDLPSQNQVQVLNSAGAALAGASVKVYRATATGSTWYGKVYDNTADLQYTTDASGKFTLPRCPFDADGTVDHTYGIANGVLILRVQAGTQVAYTFLEVTDFNKEYWRGHTATGVYTVRVNISGGLPNWAQCTSDADCQSNWCGCNGGPPPTVCLPNTSYPKTCAGTPWCSSNCAGGGWWCTGDGSCIQNGVAGHNYHCPGNNVAPDIDQACANGCFIAASGYPDYCRATTFCGGGAWCGNDCVNGYAKTLYNFSSGGSVNSVTHCQVGYTNKTCVTAPAGYNDYCN